MLDWTMISLAFVVAWTAVTILFALWSAGDARHEPAPPEIPEPHGHH